jgi:hypothetical protein
VNSDNPHASSTTPLQRTILLAGAVLIVVAILLPPWSNTNGASSGFKFLFLPLLKRVPGRVNSSLLVLELAAIAIATFFLFIAARHVVSPRLSCAVRYITVLCGLVAIAAFAWFVWPRWFIEANGVRTHRITGVRYGWSQTSRTWLTETDLEAESQAADERNRIRSKPVLDELTQIRFGPEYSDIENLKLYNPTRWQLAYSETKLKVELYQQQNRRMVLLKISEDAIGIEPGLNNIYVRGMHNFSDHTPLVQKIRIVASKAQHVNGDRDEAVLVPPFQIEHQRSCDRDPDPYAYGYKMICR